MPRQSVVKTSVETNATPDLRDKMDIRATAKCPGMRTGKCGETILDEYQKCQSAALIAVAGHGKLNFVSLLELITTCAPRHAGAFIPAVMLLAATTNIHEAAVLRRLA